MLKNLGRKEVDPRRFTEGENAYSANANDKFFRKIVRCSLPFAIHLYRHDGKKHHAKYKRKSKRGKHRSLPKPCSFEHIILVAIDEERFQHAAFPTSQPRALRVIPGRREAASPESRHARNSNYSGFRVRAFGAPRNDRRQAYWKISLNLAFKSLAFFSM